jgi:hypothetical protein
MDVRNRRSVRQIFLCVAVPVSLALMAALAPSPAAAYTADQRAACEGDAMRLCSAYVKDINHITACMKRNRRNLSAGCRAVFEGGSKRRAQAN